ncbi:MAG: tetratricopeptide repeat protein, partial [Gemmatimonadales bacterium]
MTDPLPSFAQDSARLVALWGLAERGRYREVLDQLRMFSREEMERRTLLALLAAEAHGRLGEHDEAAHWAATALRRARSQGQRHAELRARNYQGAIALERGDGEEAAAHSSEALQLAHELGDHAAEARCLNNLGIIAQLYGTPRSALATYKLALAAYQQAGVLRGMAETHHNLGISLRDLGDYRRALEDADEAVRLAGLAGDESLMTLTLAGRAELHLLLGDLDLAEAELARAAAAGERLRDPAATAEAWR